MESVKLSVFHSPLYTLNFTLKENCPAIFFFLFKNIDNYLPTSYNENIILSKIVGNAMKKESSIDKVFREEINC